MWVVKLAHLTGQWGFFKSTFTMYILRIWKNKTCLRVVSTWISIFYNTQIVKKKHQILQQTKEPSEYLVASLHLNPWNNSFITLKYQMSPMISGRKDYNINKTIVPHLREWVVSWQKCYNSEEVTRGIQKLYTVIRLSQNTLQKYLIF